MIRTENSYDVIIAGAGPAGASAAIHLAAQGACVLLIEQKTFPRAKVCGEFISPECLPLFERLGVAADMESAQPARIVETVFYSQSGKKTVVPSSWFGGGVALGLSRATMDDNLLRRAKSVGVKVLESATVSRLVQAEGIARGVRVKENSVEREYRAKVIVDATGRSRVLARKVDSLQKSRAKLVAFKAHVKNARGSNAACEIYSYPGGYGGLSAIENDVSNLCFIIDTDRVKRARSAPDLLFRESVMLNRRAAFTLAEVQVQTEWLSVALEAFGRRKPSPVTGLLAVGDSASFIDPFTGSGMLMALESGQLVAEQIVRHLDKLRVADGIVALCSDYTRAYRDTFNSRLRVCGLLRRVAFQPRLAQFTISLCASSDRLRGRLARATRSGEKANMTSAGLS